MRPLYAIAPLALLLTLFGPTPHEANKALDDFKARFAAPKLSSQQADNAGTSTGTSLGKPAILATERGEGSSNGGVIETAFHR